jgi:hypothetical protein
MSVIRLLVTANIFVILITLMMEAIRSSETSILIRAKRRNIPEDGILHSRRRENLRSFRSKGVYQPPKVAVASEATFTRVNTIKLLVLKFVSMTKGFREGHST